MSSSSRSTPESVSVAVRRSRRSNTVMFCILFALLASIEGVSALLGSETVGECERTLGWLAVGCFAGWLVESCVSEFRLRLDRIEATLKSIREYQAGSQTAPPAFNRPDPSSF